MLQVQMSRLKVQVAYVKLIVVWNRGKLGMEVNVSWSNMDFNDIAYL